MHSVTSNAVYNNCVRKEDTSSYVAYKNNKSVVHLANIGDTEYIDFYAYDIEAHNNAPNYEKVIGLRDIARYLGYSNSEIDTGIKDINGDIIYARTITATITTNSDAGIAVATITNVKNFIKCEGVLKMGSTYAVAVPYFHASNDYNDFFFRYGYNNLYFRGQLAELPAYLTLKAFHK